MDVVEVQWRCGEVDCSAHPARARRDSCSVWLPALVEDSGCKQPPVTFARVTSMSRGNAVYAAVAANFLQAYPVPLCHSCCRGGEQHEVISGIRSAVGAVGIRRKLCVWA